MLTRDQIKDQLNTVACLGGQGNQIADKVLELLESQRAEEMKPVLGCSLAGEPEVVEAFLAPDTGEDEFPALLDEFEKFLLERPGEEVLTDTVCVSALLDRAHERARTAGAPTWDKSVVGIVDGANAQLQEALAGVIDEMADAEDAKTKKALLEKAAARVRAYGKVA